MSESERDFGRVYAEFEPKVRRYLARLVGERDAEDLTQTVFLKASRALRDFRGESALSTWIYRIAANTATDWMRSDAFRRAIPEVLANVSSNGEPVEQAAGINYALPQADQALIRREMNQCIRQVVERLPEHYREVIALSEIEGLKNAEIAETLGVGIDTVKIRLHRARGKLRTALEARCTFHRDERHELACDRKGCP